MIIMLYFDKGYAHWAPLLMESFSIHEPDCKFTLYTYNLSKEEVAKFEDSKNVLFVKNRFMEFDPKVASRWLYQLVCKKGGFLLDTMDRFPGEDLYVSMDIDMMLVHPLDELKEQMKNHDIGFVWVKDDKVASGFIVASDTRNARRYIKEFHNRATDGFMEHKNDQPTLAKLYNENKDKMNFLLLTRQYIDHFSRDDAFVWSAHKTAFGNKKVKYKKYREFLKGACCGKIRKDL